MFLFAETMEYVFCFANDMSRSRSVGRSVGHSVNFPGGGANFEHIA